MNVAHEIDSMQLLSRVEFNAMKELFSADAKKFSKGHKFRCVHDIGKCRPERAGVAKIRLADLLKIHLGVELDSQDGKSSCERVTASKKEADTRSK